MSFSIIVVRKATGRALRLHFPQPSPDISRLPAAQEKCPRKSHSGQATLSTLKSPLQLRVNQTHGADCVEKSSVVGKRLVALLSIK